MCLVIVTKTDAQLKSFKLSFIWGKIRAAAQETALENRSKEASGYKRDFGEGMHAIEHVFLSFLLIL